MWAPFLTPIFDSPKSDRPRTPGATGGPPGEPEPSPPGQVENAYGRFSRSARLPARRWQRVSLTRPYRLRHDDARQSPRCPDSHVRRKFTLAQRLATNHRVSSLQRNESNPPVVYAISQIGHTPC